MPISFPAHLATIRRGTATEAVIRGHVAVVDSAGRLIAAAGDPTALTTVRSCVKPVQALPLVRLAGAGLDLSQEEIALACSSHGGETSHVEVVRRLLARIGLDEDSLSCGVQLPMDEPSAEAILAAGGRPSRLTNNCSGKHAGMLAVCAVRSLPVNGYADGDHPLQVEIRGIMADLAGVDLAAAPVGIDGCGLPTYGMRLEALARMFAAATGDPGFRLCQAAMAGHPYLVAGRERFDTALLEVAGSGMTAKGGAAGVWVAVRRPDGPALAIKLEAGDQLAMSAVALAALERLGWLDQDQLGHGSLAGFAAPPVRNWVGAVVGEIAAEPGWLEHHSAA